MILIFKNVKEEKASTMQQIGNTIEKTFSFEDVLNKSIKCSIKIIIKEMKYKSGKIYYYIDYENSDVNRSHPLFDKKEHIYGEIVYKNPMTENLINMLVMDDEALGKLSGNTHPNCYRKSLMRIITLIYD